MLIPPTLRREEALCRYLAHVTAAVPLRRIAGFRGITPGALSRQMARVEGLRDDPLIDDLLDHAACAAATALSAGEPALEEIFDMMARALTAARPDPEHVRREAKRILRRLSETGAVLALAPGFEQAVVLRDTGAGRPVRIAVVGRDVARAFAAEEWIALEGKGRVMRYGITALGRAALKRFLAEADAARKTARTGEVHPRVNVTESPVTALSRKRDADGSPFLSPREADAGERLREDFERAQMGAHVTQNWDRFLTAEVQAGRRPVSPAEGGSAAARDRVHGALAALGPGLSDIALRCCCFLEGLEAAERRLGWSRRSGKVVLKIALARLATHYEGLHGAA